MPQPLSSVSPSSSPSFGSHSIRERGELAQQMMQVLSYWTHIDGNLTFLFSRLLQADVRAGAAVFDSLQTTPARKAALFAAANSTLADWECLAIKAVWNATAASRKQRNVFAHQIAGIAPELPHAILLAPPEVITEVNLSHRMPERYLNDGTRVLAPKPLDFKRISVWHEKDVRGAVEAAEHADLLFGLLSRTVGYQPIEQVRRDLLNDSAFRRAIEPLAAKANDLVQQQLAPPGDDPPAPGISRTWDENLGRDMKLWESRHFRNN